MIWGGAQAKTGKKTQRLLAQEKNNSTQQPGRKKNSKSSTASCPGKKSSTASCQGKKNLAKVLPFYPIDSLTEVWDSK